MRSSLQSNPPPARLVKPRTCGPFAGASVRRRMSSMGSACGLAAGGAAPGGPGRIRMRPRSSSERCRLPLRWGRAPLVSMVSAPSSEVSPSVAVSRESETRPSALASELDRLSAPGSGCPASIRPPSQLARSRAGGCFDADKSVERQPGGNVERPVVAGLDGPPGKLEGQPTLLLLQHGADRRQGAHELPSSRRARRNRPWPRAGRRCRWRQAPARAIRIRGARRRARRCSARCRR